MLVDIVPCCYLLASCIYTSTVNRFRPFYNPRTLCCNTHEKGFSWNLCAKKPAVKKIHEWNMLTLFIYAQLNSSVSAFFFYLAQVLLLLLLSEMPSRSAPSPLALWRRMRSSRPLCVSIKTFQHCPPPPPPTNNPHPFQTHGHLSNLFGLVTTHTQKKEEKKEKKWFLLCPGILSFKFFFFFEWMNLLCAYTVLL